MTISSTVDRVNYTGDGTTTTFSYPFKIFKDSDLGVYSDGNLDTLGTDYTVTGVGENVGGTVVYITAPGAVPVTLIRQTPLTQPADFVSGDSFPAETLEDALDRLTMLCQQLQAEIERTPRVALQSSHVPSLIPMAFSSLPTPSEAAGFIVVVNDSNTTTWGATIAGGGSGMVLAFCNGTAWTVAGA